MGALAEKLRRKHGRIRSRLMGLLQTRRNEQQKVDAEREALERDRKILSSLLDEI